MKKALLLITFLVSSLFVFCQMPARGDIVSFEVADSLSVSDIRALYTANGLPEFFAPINYPVNLYILVYATPAPTGDSMTIASGLVALPQNDTACFPMVEYNHGTLFYGQEMTQFGAEWFISVPFSTAGYVMALPDYMGFGASPLNIPHPYIHSESEASASVDMMRATRQLCDSLEIGLNGEVFLSGYSQGGHSIMATFRDIETNYSAEFDIKAVGAGSGPYDVSGISTENLLLEQPSNSFYLSFVMFSYDFIYGGLWNDPSEAFVAPYDSLLPLFYQRDNLMRPDPLFPDTAVRMLQPAFVQNVLSDSTHPWQMALRDNDLYDWAPQAPLRMYYCEADEQVSFENSIFALSQFVANGSTQAEAISIDPNLSHGACALPSILNFKAWFDGLRGGCTSIVDTTASNDTTATFIDPGLFLTEQVQLYPNPASEQVELSWTSQFNPYQILIYDQGGKVLRDFSLENQQEGVNIRLENLSNGIYFLRLKAKGGSLIKPLLIRK
ncbi:MAG: T9SS type A sorting domain-containing protein [Bacteroidota bacterium]